MKRRRRNTKKELISFISTLIAGIGIFLLAGQLVREDGTMNWPMILVAFACIIQGAIHSVVNMRW